MGLNGKEQPANSGEYKHTSRKAQAKQIEVLAEAYDELAQRHNAVLEMTAQNMAIIRFIMENMMTPECLRDLNESLIEQGFQGFEFDEGPQILVPGGH